MVERLTWTLYVMGWMQLAVLIASAMVPIRLKWRTSLGCLPLLYRQLYWVYGGYVVLGIVSLGLICITNSGELAGGSPLARAVCWYGLAFWGARLSLQAVFDAKPYLTTVWLRFGYYSLTIVFACFTIVYALAAALPR